MPRQQGVSPQVPGTNLVLYGICLTAQFSKILLAEIPNRLRGDLLDVLTVENLAQPCFWIGIALDRFYWTVPDGNDHKTADLYFGWRLIKTSLLHAKEEHCVSKRPVIPMTQKRSHLVWIVLTVYSKNCSVTP